MKRLFPVLLAGLFSTCAANAMSDREILQHLSAAHILDACKEAPGTSTSGKSLYWGEIQMLYMLAFAGDGYFGERFLFLPARQRLDRSDEKGGSQIH